MASTSTSGLRGPVAFKDADDGAIPARHPREHDAAIAALPTNNIGRLRLRRYHGVWVLDDWLPGVVSVHRGEGLAARPGDIVLASLPKSGTTWLKALAFATMARAACPPAGAGDHPLRRLNPHDCVVLVEKLFALGRGALLDAMPSPRLVCTHMPLSVLPPSIAGGDSCCKIVYICRDQKDAVVSMWHFLKRNQADVSLSEVYESVCNGTCISGPVWDHILGYWRASKAEPDRVLFLTYEDVLQDPANAVRKLARFVGQPFSAAEEEGGVVAGIVELCSLESLRGQKANREGSQGVSMKFNHDSCFRKGVAGDWKNYMTREMGGRLDAILRDKFQGSGLTLV